MGNMGNNLSISEFVRDGEESKKEDVRCSKMFMNST